MSEGHTPPRGAARTGLDRALGEWPEPPRTNEDWEDAAWRIEQRIEDGESATKAAISDDDLFAAPFPEEPGEGTGDSRARDRQRERQALQDLAKLAALTPPAPAALGVEVEAAPAARKEDSGVVNLKTLEAEDRAQRAPRSRPPAPPPKSMPAPPPLKVATATATPAPQVAPVVPIAARAVEARAPAAPPRRTGAWIASVVAAAAVAAAVSFALRPAVPPSPSSSPVAVAPAAEKAPRLETKTSGPTPSPAVVATSATVAENTVDPEGFNPHALPSVQVPAAPTKSAPKPGAKDAPSAVAAVSTTTAPPSATVAQSNDERLMQEILKHEGMLPAAGTSAPTGTESPVVPGSVPSRPSQGAISASLSRVSGGARACLGPEDGTSNATVVFRSNGTVQGVSISGDAQGKPAEACIRAALSRATIAPFAEPSYRGFLVVRPN